MTVSHHAKQRDSCSDMMPLQLEALLCGHVVLLQQVVLLLLVFKEH